MGDHDHPPAAPRATVAIRNSVLAQEVFYVLFHSTCYPLAQEDSMHGGRARGEAEGLGPHGGRAAGRVKRKREAILETNSRARARGDELRGA